MSSTILKAIRDRLDRTVKYGVNDEYTHGYIDALAFMEHIITENEQKKEGKDGGNQR